MKRLTISPRKHSHSVYGPQDRREMGRGGTPNPSRYRAEGGMVCGVCQVRDFRVGSFWGADCSPVSGVVPR